MIYHIAEIADWHTAQLSGEFTGTDLAREGFIHCSTRGQVLRTAQEYFAGKQGLVLLEIDDARIGESVRCEDLAGQGESFPHVYSPIPLATITRHFVLVPDDKGVFSLPLGM